MAVVKMLLFSLLCKFIPFAPWVSNDPNPASTDSSSECGPGFLPELVSRSVAHIGYSASRLPVTVVPRLGA